jgi:hypothetical protein
MLIRPLSVNDESVLWQLLYHAIYVPKNEHPPSPDKEILWDFLAIRLLTVFLMIVMND